MSSTIFIHFTGNPSIPAALWSCSNVFHDCICSCWENVESVGNDITNMTSIVNLEIKLRKDTNDRSEGHNLKVSVKFLPLSLLPSVL